MVSPDSWPGGITAKDKASSLHSTTEMKRDEAENLALNIAAFLFSNEERLVRFLGSTGIGYDDLKYNLTKPETQTGILEYLLSREDLLIEFCEAHNVDPVYPKAAAITLSGLTPDW